MYMVGSIPNQANINSISFTVQSLSLYVSVNYSGKELFLYQT